MTLITDVHYRYALDRQQRLRAEAAAHRLVSTTPVRQRLARLLYRVTSRFDAAPASGGRARRDTAAEHI
jgi:hypothetical protein